VAQIDLIIPKRDQYFLDFHPIMGRRTRVLRQNENPLIAFQKLIKGRPSPAFILKKPVELYVEPYYLLLLVVVARALQQRGFRAENEMCELGSTFR
jgi:hypothetical protein